MNIRFDYLLVSVFFLICVVNVAKSNEEKVQISRNSNSSADSVESGNFKPKIVARKGAPIETLTNPVEEERSQDEPIKNVIPLVATSNSTLNATTPTSIQNVSAVSVIISTTLKPSVTIKTSISNKLTTRKPKKKPTVSLSADDSPTMQELEKNINYTIAKSDEVIDPKTSSLSDRTVVGDENRTRRNYILYMGLAFALPMAFTLIHFSYKKIRNWMEIRHYQRVDFLVDGMYIS